MPALQELRCRIPVGDGVDQRVALIRKDDRGGDPQCYGQAKNGKDDDALASFGYSDHHRFTSGRLKVQSNAPTRPQPAASIASWNIGALFIIVAAASAGENNIHREYAADDLIDSQSVIKCALIKMAPMRLHNGFAIHEAA